MQEKKNGERPSGKKKEEQEMGQAFVELEWIQNQKVLQMKIVQMPIEKC